MKKSALFVIPSILLACGGLPALAVVGEFRVLPYQQMPTQEGMTFNWFTTSNVAGTISVTGPGLASAIELTSTPQLVPVLDYQVPAELSAGGAFPFSTTAIFSSPGVPARNFKHSVTLTSLLPDTEYSYTVTQGASTYSNTFRTAPGTDTSRRLRFTVLSDSETLVSGRTRFREWARTTPQTLDSTGRPAGTGRGRDAYFLSETVGYQENIKQIEKRDPDMIIMPGDLIEGTGNEQQRRWDEFWRHNAGAYDDLLSARPLVAAIGNNCIFNGVGSGEPGTGGPLTNLLISYARQQWSAYFDWPSNGSSAFQDLYYRTDYGPVTVITLCSVKATEEANSRVAPPQGQGLSVNFPSNRDTNRAWFSTPYAPGDIPDFNVGTTQWNWAVDTLAAARAEGRIIFVQWHHTPFSRGVHGSSVTSTQSGEAMRIYAPLMEQFRVAGVFNGHSEVAELSYFDLDNDGYGVHLWDVGAAGDGLRGVEDAPGLTNAAITAWRNNPINPQGSSFTMNPYNLWSADQNEPELWIGNKLVRGGKHYGFLEVDVQPLDAGRFRLSFANFHNFPINNGDSNFTVTGYQLRRYNNTIVLEGTPDDLRPVAVCFGDLTADAQVDDADFVTFAISYDVLDCSDPSMPLSCQADFTGDGVVDDADFLVFVTSYEKLFCP